MIEQTPRATPSPGARSERELLIDNSADPLTRGQTPPVPNLKINFYEEGPDFVIEAQLPGMTPADIDVTLEDDVLTISAGSLAEHERVDCHYITREFRHGRFTRSVQLPDFIDRSSILANYENGILRLMLPRADAYQGRRIPVIRNGMVVQGTDGEEIGRVKEVRGDELLVDRRFRRDIYIPIREVQEIVGDRVIIDVSADKVDDMGWRHPAIIPIGASHQSPEKR
jgi:HSP20 family protein